MLRFNKKLVSRIRELRDELKISQQELAKSVGVSRQTIYYLERGASNPSLTLSMDISKVLKRSIEQIFFYEPIIKDFLGEKTLEELDEIAEITNITVERITNLRKINDKQLSELYTENELKKIATAFGVKFRDLFLKDEAEV